MVVLCGLEHIVQAEVGDGGAFGAFQAAQVPGAGVAGIVHDAGAVAIDDLVDQVQADPVEHDGGDNLIDVQVGLEQTGDGAPQAAQDGGSHQAHIPGQMQHDGAVQRAVGAQGVLPGGADVEQAGLESKGHRKAGHHQGGGVGQGAAHAVGGVIEAALQNADEAVGPGVLGVDGQQHQVAAHQADQDAQQRRQHADKGGPALAAVGKHLFLGIHKADHSPFPCLRAPAI